MQRLLDFLSQRSGLSLTHDRGKSIADGVRRAMRQSGHFDADQFLLHIQQNQAAFDALMAEVTIGETYFYREPDQFEAIRTVVLPEIRNRKGFDHVARIWSAGCASGEEPWSLAMLCQQAGFGQQTRILATDISRAALRKAETGEYRQWSLRGPSKALAGSLIHETNDRWKIDDSLRRSVVFEYLNLALDNYPSLATGTWGCDLILCRNVLIYFDEATIQLVASRLYEALAPGGWLVLASTDPRMTPLAPFELVEAGQSLFYRRPLNPVTPVAPLDSWQAPDDAWVFEEVAADSVDSTIIKSDDVTITAAQQALRAGDSQRAAELTADSLDDPAASALHVRALAGNNVGIAESICARCVRTHVTNPELHYLHGVLLLDLQRLPEAEKAVRKALFLDRELTIAHFTLGVILQRSGSQDKARRSFQNALQLCERLQPEAVIPLSDGEHAGRLAQMAKQHLDMLGRGTSS